MNPATFAIAEVLDTIPKEVLKLAFGNRTNRGYIDQDSLIEQNIFTKIIDSRIRRHIDIVGPQELEIQLKNSWKKVVDLGSFKITIPIEVTKGKRLTSIKSITYMRTPIQGSMVSSGYQTVSGVGRNGGSIHSANSKILQASTSPILFTTSDVDIIGKNVILVRAIPRNISQFLLNGIFGADKEFTNLPKGIEQYFAKAVIDATQAHIYKECYIKLSTGALTVGKGHDEIREVVSDYRSSNETFEKESLPLLRKAIRVNDPVRKRKHIQLAIGGKT